MTEWKFTPYLDISDDVQIILLQKRHIIWGFNGKQGGRTYKNYQMFGNNISNFSWMKSFIY